MNPPLRIAVADDEADMRDFLCDALPDLGHEVVVVARTGRELLEQCRLRKPDMIISDIKMPEMDGIKAVNELTRQRPIPIILVSAYYDRGLIERAQSESILAYLVKPIGQADLETAIAIAVRRFEQFEALRNEATDLRQALEDRKVIERAKGILMRRAAVDEPDAFRRLQRLARDENKKLIEVARVVITAEKALGPDLK